MRKRPIRTHISSVNLTRKGVPRRMQHLRVEDIFDYGDKDRMKVTKKIQKYIADLSVPFENAEGIFLYGNNGTGKTTIASILVTEAYIQRFTSRRVTFAEYIELYTKTWNCKDHNEKLMLQEELISKYKGIEFLVLEEIGKEIDTKITLPILEDLLRYREDKGLPTIICTNMTPSMVKEKFGASVMSLIKGNMTPIKLVGEDRRVD